ncbi:MAG: hypothetical protein K8S98_15070 [Planctomycetes bacterium]|nr:hypothetical protein [Planctomycetota bacterium]
MNDKKQNLGRDLLGIVLFAAGAFLSVVVLMCYWKGASASDYAGSFFVDKELIRWFGRPACLVLGVVVCGLGARMFLVGPPRELIRALVIGGVCLALGTSILMGALNVEYGGVFGALIGTWASANLSKFVGIPLGLICVFVPVWFAWLRPGATVGEKEVGELAPSADRSTEAGSGVTAEEAAELIPRRVVAKVDPAPRAELAPTRPLDPLQKTPVPTGATALQPTHEPLERAHPSQAPAVSERSAADLPFVGDAAGEDLALAAIAEEPRGKRTVVVKPVDELEEVGPPVPLTKPAPIEVPVAPPVAVVHVEIAKVEAPEAPAELRPTPKTIEPAPLAAPSWEQPAEPESEVDDLPVDAYGTPMTLVEELRRDSTVQAAAAKEDELEAAVEENDDDEATRFDVAKLEDEDDQLEVDEDDDEEEEEEASEEQATAVVETEEEVDEEEEVEEAEEAKPALDPDEALRREAPLFAAPRPARVVAEEPAAPPKSLRDVVLQPQPAAASAVEPVEPIQTGPSESESAEVVAGDMSEEDELVFKAGVLFLERQRVAVSMLQREFSLDFEAATRVLDRLQAAGLIGPYLGGQRRDILLTLEQWRSRAVAR